jgi:hypothetical protein
MLFLILLPMFSAISMLSLSLFLFLVTFLTDILRKSGDHKLVGPNKVASVAWSADGCTHWPVAVTIKRSKCRE